MTPAGIVVPGASDWQSAGSVNLPADLAAGTYVFGGVCGSGATAVSDSISLVVASANLLTDNFSLSASPTSYRANFVLSPSSPKTFNTTISIDRATTFTQAVNLSVSGVPTGIAVSVLPTNPAFPAVASGGYNSPVSLSILVSKTAPSGVSKIHLVGATGGAAPVTSVLDIPITVTKSASSGEI
jgi:hypothetical protein